LIAGTVAGSAFVAAVALGAELKVPAPAVAPASGPNILFIVTDDQRANSLGFMPKTRRWFANGGRSFTRAVATNPLCCPSRASIFSGDYSHNHGVLTNEDTLALDHSTTLEAALQGAGYQTYIAGKYLNDWDVEVEPPYFDEWAIFADDSATNLYRGETWSINGNVTEKPRYTTKLVGKYALDFLDRSEADDDRPWLMYVFPFAPHAPYTPARKYADADVGKWEGNPAVFGSRRDKPLWVRSEKSDLREGRKIRNGQLRTQMSVDDVVGDLMDQLGAMGERSNTLAVFTSDNGIHWAEHGLTVKRYPYKPSYHVPMMLRWPAGDIAPGTKAKKIVANIDLAPTALDAAGQPDPDTDGRSLLDPGGRDRILLESWASNLQSDDLPDWAATYTGDSQYTEYYNEAEELIFREYFNLKEDPFQLDNLLRDGDPSNNPDVGDLSATLEDDRDCVVVDCP
jgi:arylsulfatase A-like enzyme